MIQLFEIAALFFETFLGLWFPAKTLKNERIEWKKTIMIAMVLTIIVGILNQYAVFSVWTSIVGIILISVGTCCIHQIKYIEVLPMTGFYMMLVYACDFLCLSSIGVVLHVPEFAVHAASDLSWHRSIFLIATKILTFLITIFLPGYILNMVLRDIMLFHFILEN